ncbi:MAG TPA: stage VI sporulation protein F [Bacillales bacterium]|nr:stage VI sporulation protein F [Bacillales bacterium]
MDQNNDFFKDIEERTNVGKQDLFEFVNSIQNQDFSDEESVRQLISGVSQLAGVPVSEEKEEKLMKAIVNNEIPMDFSTLAKMFNQSK